MSNIVKINNNAKKGDEESDGQKKSGPEIKVVLNLTEGWKKRVAEAAYNLYLRLESKER